MQWTLGWTGTAILIDLSVLTWIKTSKTGYTCSTHFCMSYCFNKTLNAFFSLGPATFYIDLETAKYGSYSFFLMRSLLLKELLFRLWLSICLFLSYSFPLTVLQKLYPYRNGFKLFYEQPGQRSVCLSVQPNRVFPFASIISIASNVAVLWLASTLS